MASIITQMLVVRITQSTHLKFLLSLKIESYDRMGCLFPLKQGALYFMTQFLRS